MPSELETMRRDLDALREQFRGAIPLAIQLTIARLERQIRRLEQEQHYQGGGHEQKS